MINVSCIHRSCGVVFGIPEHIETQARGDNARQVHCPNGHAFVYTDSEPEKLRKQIAALESKVASKQSYIDSLEETANRHRRLIVYWKGIAHRQKGRNP